MGFSFSFMSPAMPDIKLYGSPMGTGFRCHWMLKELGLDYTQMPLDMKAKEHKSPEYLVINPAGQVPAIIVDGFVLAESLAINWYLGTRFNPSLLGATSEAQATALRWSLWVVLNPERQFSTLATPRWSGVHDEPAEAAAMAKLPALLPILEAYLADKPYLAGDTFSVADINAGASFQYAGFVNYDLGAYPNIQAWIERISARPAYIAAKG